MSRLSKVTLTLAMMVSAGVVGYVHYKQTTDREKLHEGVVRDLLRQQKRKVENTYALQQQIDKTKKLKADEAESAQEKQAAEKTEAFETAQKLESVKSNAEEKFHQVFETSQSTEGKQNEEYSRAPQNSKPNKND